MLCMVGSLFVNRTGCPTITPTTCGMYRQPFWSMSTGVRRRRIHLIPQPILYIDEDILKPASIADHNLLAVHRRPQRARRILIHVDLHRHRRRLRVVHRPLNRARRRPVNRCVHRRRTRPRSPSYTRQPPAPPRKPQQLRSIQLSLPPLLKPPKLVILRTQRRGTLRFSASSVSSVVRSYAISAITASANARVPACPPTSRVSVFFSV